MKLKLIHALLILVASTTLAYCRKEIKLPSETLKPLLTQWKHTLSINYNLGTSTKNYPGSNTENLEFEFTKKGFCYWETSDDKVLNRLKFTLQESNGEYKISYSDANRVRHGIVQVPHIISKITPDSLVLADECSDCYTHIFVKN